MLILVALVVGSLAIVMVAAAAILRFRDETVTRLAAIERRLTAIMQHLGVPEQEPETADIIAHLDGGRTAEAVRVYRRRTGTGLIEAKKAVDDIDRRRASGPEG